MATASRQDHGRWLVFGLTGAIGDGLRDQRGPGDPDLLAVSRRPGVGGEGIAWAEADLAARPAWHPPAGPIDAIASLGPLDHFAAWFEASGLAPPRVVAVGSTSVHGKRDSPDPAERALAVRLAEAEQRLAREVAARGGSLTLLRPTLVYGRGRDQNLTRLVRLARRWRWLPLPRTAGGLRQPVHADEVAAAVLAALRAPQPVPGAFDLPGGETLRYDEMVRRCLAAAAPEARLVRVPTPLFRVALALARGLGRAPAGPGVFARLGQDLAFDPGPARAALGWSPGPFRPRAGMFGEG